MLLWDGRPARPFWTGGTPIPQTCGSYLILIPYLKNAVNASPASVTTLLRNCQDKLRCAYLAIATLSN
ncbi:hypothetical protein [Microcoleus sp. OTE_8_concoct_300]|uniref:hypothetical protein n=1 Tax=Microcoleus sp. OTE_8_concoct_300 TaxID=2964710 RepID=UPI00403F0432